MKWSEAEIARALQRQVFANALVAVPRCSWTGSECDLLVVPRCMRVVDVEVKVSRADLRADAGKDKWWRRRYGRPDEPLDWPARVWKHYYAVPEEIWDDGLIPAVPAKSGILLLARQRSGSVTVAVRRRVTADKQAKPLEPAQVLDIARLASLRMWDALHREARREPGGGRRRAAVIEPGTSVARHVAP